MKIRLISLAAAAFLFTSTVNAAFTIDLTGNNIYDSENPLNIAFTDGVNSAIATLIPTGGSFNSNAGDFGIGNDQIDGTSEIVTITFDKAIEFNFIDFGGVGSTISDGAKLTIAGVSTDLFTGVTGFSGSSDTYTPSSPIEIAIGQSIGVTGSSATSSFDIQTINVSIVPEPNTYALIAGMFALVSVMFQRRSKK
jgi:hypothetical protein